LLLALVLAVAAEETSTPQTDVFLEEKDRKKKEAGGGEGNDKPAVVVKPGATIFAHYGYLLGEDADGFNEFSLDRAYFMLAASMGQYFSARLTLDVGRMKPIEVDGAEYTYDTRYRAFLKHAWLEYKLPVPGMAVRGGVVDTGYGPFYDNFWQHRFIAESFAAENGFVSTADLGVSLLGEHSGGLVSYNLGFINGEGYKNPEVNAGKAVQLRMTIDPMARPDAYALPLTGFFSYNSQGPDADPILTYAGALGFKMQYFWFWGEYMGESIGEDTRSGFAITAIPRIPKTANLVVRYGRMDPDTSAENDAYDQLIVGVSREVWDKIALAATYESTMYQADSVDPESGVFIHMLAGF
jgi:hypothetical protein